MMAKGDGLNCRQCLKNKRKNPSFLPDCMWKRCRNSDCQTLEVESFISFWQMLRVSDSVPKELFLNRANLDISDLELMVLLDSEINAYQAEERARKQ